MPHRQTIAPSRALPERLDYADPLTMRAMRIDEVPPWWMLLFAVGALLCSCTFVAPLSLPARLWAEGAFVAALGFTGSFAYRAARRLSLVHDRGTGLVAVYRASVRVGVVRRGDVTSSDHPDALRLLRIFMVTGISTAFTGSLSYAALSEPDVFTLLAVGLFVASAGGLAWHVFALAATVVTWVPVDGRVVPMRVRAREVPKLRTHAD